jgi:hypothetical protein
MTRGRGRTVLPQPRPDNRFAMQRHRIRPCSNLTIRGWHPRAAIPGCLLLLIVELAVVDRCRADDLLLQRFRSEAPAAWKAYLETSLEISGSVVGTTTDLSTNEVTERFTRDILVAGDWAVCTYWPDPVNPPKGYSGTPDACGVNSRYAFRLAQGATREDWVIEKLLPLAESLAEDRGVAWSATQGADPLHVPFILYPARLMKIAASDAFQVHGARAVKREGEDLVELSFSYMPTDEKAVREEVRIPRGTLLLDPSRYWLLREAEFEASWPLGEVGKNTVRFDFDDSIASVPLVRKYTSRVIGAPTPGSKAESYGLTAVDYQREITFDLRRIEAPSERDFTLSAFGLPEPYQPENAWLWWMLGIGLALIAGAYLWRRAAAR